MTRGNGLHFYILNMFFFYNGDTDIVLDTEQCVYFIWTSSNTILVIHNIVSIKSSTFFLGGGCRREKRAV